MRKYFLTAFVLASVLVLATSGLALEKTVRALPDASRPGDWNAGATCSVVYYNICTGWGFGFSGWVNGDVVGTCFDNCCTNPAQPAVLATSWWFLFSGAPSGYGFTGSADVFAGDAQHCKVGPPLASTVWLPGSGWNFFSWGVPVPDRFIICGTFTDSGDTLLPSPVVSGSDHPNAGPTGPPSCGTCFSSTRISNSYVYASVGTTTPCPPNKSPLSSPAFAPCDAVEWLMDAQLNCTVAVEESSWGTIKGLYR